MELGICSYILTVTAWFLVFMPIRKDIWEGVYFYTVMRVLQQREGIVRYGISVVEVGE